MNNLETLMPAALALWGLSHCVWGWHAKSRGRLIAGAGMMIFAGGWTVQSRLAMLSVISCALGACAVIAGAVLKLSDDRRRAKN